MKKGEVSARHSLSTIANVPQVRMTRRLCGVESMGQEDNKKRSENSKVHTLLSRSP